MLFLSGVIRKEKSPFGYGNFFEDDASFYDVRFQKILQ